MRYQTPQFIEVEDKIFGPLTLKQFIYLAGMLALSYFFYQFLPIYLAILLIIPTIGLGFALAFYKVNNKPFVFLLESALKFTINKKLYIWKKGVRTPEESQNAASSDNASLYVPRLSNSKLRDLTWSLDVKQSINPAISKDNQTNT